MRIHVPCTACDIFSFKDLWQLSHINMYLAGGGGGGRDLLNHTQMCTIKSNIAEENV